ncbi:O-antigen ligase family protein [Bacteroides sp. 224]|uniref:O-antigen ligase family protein n=1 Tax=Bacteroides sp. 224 TaxID=2302936 RepID=UPI0013D480A0|nr:O-antigen ligase family protein [Bacteroides sp. 224]
MGAMFFSSFHFVDSQIVPKWIITIAGIILLSIYLIIIISVNPVITHKIPQRHILRLISITILFQSLYGILQYFNICAPTNAFPVMGSFDNPAGFAASLCAGLPFCILGIIEAKGKMRWVLGFIPLLTTIAVLLSESRSGIFSTLILFICLGIRYLRISDKIKWVTFPIILIIAITSLYYLKKDSALGRLLVWECSISMLKSNLLTGYGTGGFEANYMDYQANYFKNNPQSSYTMLADNIQYPFCEYLRILVDYGLIGLLLLGGWIAYLVFCFYKYPSKNGVFALLCWITIGSFSLFSYPLMYPFVWLVLFYSTFILVKNHVYLITKKIPVKWLKIGALLSLFFLSLSGIKLYERVKAEIEWAHLAKFSYSEDKKYVLSQYNKIEKELGKDRYFLYNYAAELYQAGLYGESLVTAEKCRTLWADYDLEILLGQIKEELNQNEKAVNHYRTASYMCPNRFMPLYHIVLVLNKLEKNEEAQRVAKIIMDKPIKIPSSTIDQIKKEMNQLLIQSQSRKPSSPFLMDNFL